MIIKDIELSTFSRDLNQQEKTIVKETNFSKEELTEESCLFCEAGYDENTKCRNITSSSPEVFNNIRRKEESTLRTAAMMTLNRSVSSFTSYVDLDTEDNHDNNQDDARDTIEPRLLSGEMVVTSGDGVALYSSSSSG